jgi:uroporphyrinogen-III synthase
MRVAITRAAQDAELTIQRVRAYGHEPVPAPLLDIAPVAFDANIDGVQALMFTSAAGVRAFAAATTERQCDVLTVGDATADAARSAGFARVRSANGDVLALAALAQANLEPRAGKLIHMAGTHIAGDLVGALKAAGFEAERRIAYEARQAATLPEAFNGPLDIVLFYSARAALAFRALGAPHAELLTAGVLSKAVAEAAGDDWARIVVAPKPREEALLTALFGLPTSPAGASA